MKNNGMQVGETPFSGFSSIEKIDE